MYWASFEQISLVDFSWKRLLWRYPSGNQKKDITDITLWEGIFLSWWLFPQTPKGGGDGIVFGYGYPIRRAQHKLVPFWPCSRHLVGGHYGSIFFSGWPNHYGPPCVNSPVLVLSRIPQKRLEHGIQMMIPLLTHSHHLQKTWHDTNAWWICGTYLPRLEKCSSEIVRDTQQWRLFWSWLVPKSSDFASHVFDLPSKELTYPTLRKRTVIFKSATKDGIC